MKEALLNTINQVIGILESFKVSVSAYFESRERTDKKFAEDKAAFESQVADKTAELTAREDAVKSIEDIVAYKKGAQDLLARAGKEFDESQVRLNAVIEREKKADKDIAEKFASLKAEDDRLKAVAKDLDERKNKLNEEIIEQVKTVLSKTKE